MHRSDGGRFTRITYSELQATVDRVAESLAKIGCTRGDSIAICGYHGVDWVIADLAVLKLGAVVVPIYPTLSPPAAAFILKDSGARLAFAEDARAFDAIESIRGDIPRLRNVVVFDPHGLEGRKGVIRFSDLKAGHKLSCEMVRAGEVREGPAEVSPEDTATIVYTSGTTGEPKGAVLTHGNIVANALGGIARFGVAPEDVYLSVLPMCHVLERIAGCYSHLFAGSTIAYGGGVATIVEDARRIRPTHLAVVPRIIDKACEAAGQRVARSSRSRRMMVNSAIANLNRRANLLYAGKPVPPLLKLKCWFYDRTVAARFRRTVGGRLRLLICGGAPLDKKLAKLVWILGFNIVEGYGLTEASLAVSTTTLEDNHLGTVGKPYPGTEVRVGENDEILVRGPGVMKCYHNLPEETAAAIDKQGWLHTGDQGRFDARGNLVVTGRIKELIVTSYGKNIGPAFIEGEITRSPYIDQAILCGDRRNYVTALIVPNRETLERFARKLGLQVRSYADLLTREEVRHLVADEIEKATAACSPYEKVKAFVLLEEGFTVDNGLLTPTMKVRRSKIEQRYSGEIASMYAAQPGKP
jgi:long-chain acyl-CoA synthetase